MSIDMNDPALAAAIASVRADSGGWVLLHYRPPQSTSIALHSTGPAPALPAFRAAMDDGDDVLFGYTELDGRGMVLVYLTDKVGGVRRARAIVHSRAVAALFPDYLALVSIAHPSQLTDDLVREKLGLDSLPSTAPSPSTTVHPPAAAPVPAAKDAVYMDPNVDGPPPADAPPAMGERRLSPPRLPVAEPVGPVEDVRPPPATSTYDALLDKSTHPLELGPPIGLASDATPPVTHEFGANGTAPAVPTAAGDDRPRHASLTSKLRNPFKPQHQPRSVSLNSPTPASPEPGQPPPPSSSSFAQAHTHTESATSALTAMTLASAVSDPASASALTSPGPTSPSSPSSSRFKPSSLASAFRRKKRVSTGSSEPSSAPNSPLPLLDGPPIPPKDYPSAGMSVAGGGDAGHGHARADSGSFVPYKPPPGIKQTPSGGIGYTPPKDKRRGANGARGPSVGGDMDGGDGNDDGDVGLGAARDPKMTELKPSASASQALARARQKSVNAENEMHERFRRIEEERNRARVSAGNVAAAIEAGTATDADLGLADEGSEAPVDGAKPVFWGRPVDGDDDDDDIRLPYDGPPTPTAPHHAETLQTMWSTGAAPPDGTDVPVQPEQPVAPDQVAGQPEERDEVSAAHHASASSARDLHEAVNGLAVRDGVSTNMEAVPISAEAEDAVAVTAPTTPRPEEDEDARLAAARAKHEAAQAELAQIAAEEEERRRRAEAAKLDEERARRARVTEELRERMGGDGAMLKGVRAVSPLRSSASELIKQWITVQTLRSLTWRRRWFNLHATELRLFKNDHEPKIMTTVPLTGATLSETYEESQVKGSFKLSTPDEVGRQMGRALMVQDYFMFADSTEDKDTVLAGLALCLGR